MRDSRKQRYRILLLLCLCIATFSCKQKTDRAEEEVDSEWVGIDSLQSVYQYGICIDSLDVTDYLIKSGDNPAAIFARLGFSAAKADSISRCASDILDPKRIRAGMHYSTFVTTDSLRTIRYIAFAKSRLDFAIIDLTSDSIRAYEYNKDIRIEQKYAEGVLNASLWNTLKASGVDPLLANRIADIYGWQIDFFDVKEGDAFRVLYDVAYVDDTIPLSISDIRGAIFIHQGKEYAAIPFTQDDVSEYFDENGVNLRKAFLKAPLDFIRISSRFSNSRFHPVLKRYRAHHGVDYAAPTGTPVRTIGDGTIIAKAYEKGGGNYIKVKHNSVYTTTYMHLSKFAKGVHAGSKVRQGDVIGYVGSTGLSTGPHLDFRVHKNGQPINPLTMDAPPGDPVKPELIDSFKVVKDKVLEELNRANGLNEILISEQN